MIATNEIRFVERKDTDVLERHATYSIGRATTKLVLQQKWSDGVYYEWRDVPVVKE
jgi:hypothetical protein